jgi:hypothetical protein
LKNLCSSLKVVVAVVGLLCPLKVVCLLPVVVEVVWLELYKPSLLSLCKTLWL